MKRALLAAALAAATTPGPASAAPDHAHPAQDAAVATLDGVVVLGVAPIAATVGQWFDRKRGLALNLALSGATVAGPPGCRNQRTPSTPISFASSSA